MENEVLKLLQGGSISFGGEGFNPIQVSIGQFYGIEINDFAVTVAKTALWIAESQMMRETEDVVHMDLDFLPLKSYAHIVWGDALQLDWAEVVPPRNNLKYIIGNPPFRGHWLQTPAQKEALRRIYVDGKGKPYKGGGKIDYVAGWYFKAAQFMAGTSIRAALVATNSITQGEQVAFFWEPLFKRFGIHIDFAHRTFRWDSEATLKAQVHVVIIGFSCAPNPKPRLLFYSDQAHQVQNITPYLLDTPTIFIKSRPRALCKVPPMVAGNKPTDGGAFFLTPSEREEVLQREPQIEPFIRPVMGSQEFIYGERRYCLWLTEATPQDIRSSPFLRERVERVRQFRLASVNKATRNDAQTPHLFQQIHHKECPYILVPSVSSDRRAYIPLGFVPAEVISTNLNLMVPGATLYHFAVLTSNVHMAWMRAVCGRLGVGYRYSKDVVYNNFVWPEVNEETRQKIARCGQRILEVRSHYPQSSLADLYDPVTMPPDLRRAHQENDRAVMEAYGLPIKTTTEAACVSFLFLEFRRYITEET